LWTDQGMVRRPLVDTDYRPELAQRTGHALHVGTGKGLVQQVELLAEPVAQTTTVGARATHLVEDLVEQRERPDLVGKSPQFATLQRATQLLDPFPYRHQLNLRSGPLRVSRAAGPTLRALACPSRSSGHKQPPVVGAPNFCRLQKRNR
jgi:hypothetical protein